jgi:isopropylmalate/homocitrate/citramalate synthase
MTEFDIVQRALDVVYDSRERFYNSKWNFLPEVTGELKLPKAVSFVDTTLREGGENPWVIYPPKDKLRIARALEEIGIREIDCGQPALSPEHRETVTIIKDAKIRLKIMAVTRLDVGDYRKVIDETIAAGADVLETSIYGVPIPGCRTETDYLRLVEQAVGYGKNRGAYCAFWIPCTRWDPDFSLKLYRAAVRGGADRLDYAGTGCVSPTSMKHMVRKLKEIAPDKPVGLHCHNHTGVATACAVTGVEAGAEVIHTSVNGMSDGGGIAAFEEVVMCLTQFYGLDLGIRLEKLTALSRLVQEVTGQRVHSWKPVVGNSVFVETADSHLERILLGRNKGKETSKEVDRARWSAFGVKPEAIGQEISLVFGPSALVGRGIDAKAKTMGINLSEEMLQKIIAIMAKEFETRGSLSEEEMGELIQRLMKGR